MTPSDICIVTVRDEPGVRFGDGFYDDVPVFKNIEAIVEKEKLNPDEFHWERLGRQYAREVSRQEQDGDERIPQITYFPYPKTKQNPVVFLRRPGQVGRLSIGYKNIPDDVKPANAAHLEFAKGERVQLSEKGRKEWKQKTGVVIGYSRWPDECLRIIWDGAKTAISYHHSFIEREQTPVDKSLTLTALENTA